MSPVLGRFSPRGGAQPAQALVASADDGMRRRLAAVAAEAGMAVCGMANDADAALELARELRADVCVLHLPAPQQAHAVLEEILAAVPTTRVVLLAARERRAPFLDAMCAGAAGYLAVGTPDALLVAALRDVLGGRPAIPERLLPALVGALREGEPRPVRGD